MFIIRYLIISIILDILSLISLSLSNSLAATVVKYVLNLFPTSYWSEIKKFSVNRQIVLLLFVFLFRMQLIFDQFFLILFLFSSKHFFRYPRLLIRIRWLSLSLYVLYLMKKNWFFVSLYFWKYLVFIKIDFLIPFVICNLPFFLFL